MTDSPSVNWTPVNFYDNHVAIVRSFLLLPQNYTPLLGVAWTLIHEVYFYCIVSFALLFAVRGRWIFGFVWFLLVFTVFSRFGDTQFGNNRFLQVIFSPFSLIFLLGYFVGLTYLRIRSWFRPVLWGLCALGVAGLVVGFHFVPALGIYPNNNCLFRVVAYGLPCACLVISAVGLELPTHRGIPVLVLLGDASYAIYLTHMPLICGFYAVIKRIHPQGVFPVTVAAGICLVGCLLAAVAFNRGIERHIIKFFRNLIESKLPIAVPTPGVEPLPHAAERP